MTVPLFQFLILCFGKQSALLQVFKLFQLVRQLFFKLELLVLKITP